jgi:hypothetical protein
VFGNMKPTWESLPCFRFEWLHEKVAEIENVKLVNKYPRNHLALPLITLAKSRGHESFISVPKYAIHMKVVLLTTL